MFPKHGVRWRLQNQSGSTSQGHHRFKASSTRIQCASGKAYMREQWGRSVQESLVRVHPERLTSQDGAGPSHPIVGCYWLPGPTLLTSPTLYSAFSSVRVTPTCITVMGCEPASQVQAEQPSSSAC